MPGYRFFKQSRPSKASTLLMCVAAKRLGLMIQAGLSGPARDAVVGSANERRYRCIVAYLFSPNRNEKKK